MLEGIVSRRPGAIVAFSGGVDSTFLLSVAKDVLGDGILAVTVAAPFISPREIDEAREIACAMRVEHDIIETNILDMEEFHTNPPDRCYHCKKAIFSRMLDIAGDRGIPCVYEASNADDIADYRPGMKALRELGIISPLVEAEFTKEGIRAISKEMGLGTWNKPALACLATRIPYNEPISLMKLGQVEKGEEFLLSLGFTYCRLRHHGAIARIEVPPGEIDRFLEGPVREKVAENMRKLGFIYITIDIEGYRPGSMNTALDM